MELEKASDIAKNLIRDCGDALTQDDIDALRLGIEALKYVRDIRHYRQNPFEKLLPGETKG